MPRRHRFLVVRRGQAPSRNHFGVMYCMGKWQLLKLSLAVTTWTPEGLPQELAQVIESSRFSLLQWMGTATRLCLVALEKAEEPGQYTHG